MANKREMTPEERADYRLGREAFEAGDLSRAERHLVRVLKTHRDYADLYAMLGAVYHDKGKFADAIRLFAKALQLNPHYTEAKVNLMILFQDLGRYERARAILEELTQSADTFDEAPDPISKNKLANLHAATGDMYMAVELFDDAAKEYDKALALRPTFADIRVKLAHAHKAAGRYEAAEEHCRRALAERAGDTPARVFLGSLLMARGRRSLAIEVWKQVLSQDPNNEDAKHLLEMANGRLAVGAHESAPPVEAADAARQPTTKNQ
ncbi:MAG: tetratricopeptide repeat protein [Deltaproteobacteria bacterium]|nr:tetratricopeptide repeat protein [Deltaproteobacteria bacterium]